MVKDEFKGRAIIRPEIMMLVQCELRDAHQAIYRILNQVAASRLRVGVYVFDREGSSGSSLGERSTDRTKPPQAPQVSTSKNQVINTSQSTNTINRPTNSNSVPAQSRDYRSVLITEPSQVVQDNRVIIDDAFYPEKSSVFNRLGPTKPATHESTCKNTFDELVTVSDPNVSCITTTTQVTLEEPSAKSRCSNEK